MNMEKTGRSRIRKRSIRDIQDFLRRSCGPRKMERERDEMLRGVQENVTELVLLTAGAESEAHITIREGKFHQIKRMMAYLGKPVLYLERVRMGNLTLDPLLSRGAYRFLTPEEQAGLGNLARENGNNRNLPKK